VNHRARRSRVPAAGSKPRYRLSREATGPYIARTATTPRREAAAVEEIAGKAVASACFRFYAELNDHLPFRPQYRTVVRQLFVAASVKDMTESLGVPDTEVDPVLVNGESSDLTRLVQNDDRVSVYPMFESIDVTPVLRLLSRSSCTIFSLGMLAGNLRMLGLDTVR
jgi:hypothetical protein